MLLVDLARRASVSQFLLHKGHVKKISSNFSLWIESTCFFSSFLRNGGVLSEYSDSANCHGWSETAFRQLVFIIRLHCVHCDLLEKLGLCNSVLLNTIEQGVSWTIHFISAYSLSKCVFFCQSEQVRMINYRITECCTVLFQQIVAFGSCMSAVWVYTIM